MEIRLEETGELIRLWRGNFLLMFFWPGKAVAGALLRDSDGRTSELNSYLFNGEVLSFLYLHEIIFRNSISN
jgi:hypothetical protein